MTFISKAKIYTIHSKAAFFIYHLNTHMPFYRYFSSRNIKKCVNSALGIANHNDFEGPFLKDLSNTNVNFKFSYIQC